MYSTNIPSSTCLPTQRIISSVSWPHLVASPQRHRPRWAKRLLSTLHVRLEQGPPSPKDPGWPILFTSIMLRIKHWSCLTIEGCSKHREGWGLPIRSCLTIGQLAFLHHEYCSSASGTSRTTTSTIMFMAKNAPTFCLLFTSSRSPCCSPPTAAGPLRRPMKARGPHPRRQACMGTNLPRLRVLHSTSTALGCTKTTSRRWS
jgi:hypothetical protein